MFATPFDRYVFNPGADPTFQDLINLIWRNQPKTIGQFLASVRQRYPKYLDQYTLAYESLSIQHADYQSPRALVYGDSGRLILTFNGSPDQEGYGAIETMEYVPNRGFLFREIAFLKDGGVGIISRDDLDKSASGAHTQVSIANPKRCTQCHGEANPRPIFETYFRWPGFYGSDDDYVFRKPTSVYRTATLIGEDRERDNLIKFVHGAKERNERYRQLGSYVSAVEHNEDDVRPNFKLLTNLVRMTADRASAQISRHPDFRIFGPALTAGVLCNEPFEFVPAKYRAKLGDGGQMGRDIRRQEITYGHEKLVRMKRLVGPRAIMKFEEDGYAQNEYADDVLKKYPDLDKWEAAATVVADNKFQRLGEQQAILRYLGFDLEDWAINLRRIRSLTDGKAGQELPAQIARRFLGGWPMFSGDWTTLDEYPMPFICHSIRDKSL